MILALATVKEAIRSEPIKDYCSGAMQIMEDSVTFQLVFGAKNARPNHPYGPAITLRCPEDE